jgi:glycosyltransferase involved in cell wall biosynthesis
MDNLKNNQSANNTGRVRVSVVVPVYNHEAFVGEAINSVLSQDFDGLEIILVDDGSSDRSMDAAVEMLKTAAVPYQIHRQANQGAHVAINTGINLARGEWIAILNSDDKFAPARISRLMDHAAQTNSRFVFSRVNFIDDKGQPLAETSLHRYYYEWAVGNRDLYPTPGFGLLRHQYAISTGNFFFQRAIVEEAGSFQDFKICHDWDFILRALLVTEISFLDEALYEYRVHPNNTVRPSVHELRHQEMDTLLSGYLQNAESSTNPLAPCYKNWGPYWMKFAGSQISFGYLPKTSEAIKRILTGPRPDPAPILDLTRLELLAAALETSQNRALYTADVLTNTRKELESLAGKSMSTLIKEKLKRQFSRFHSKNS